jgi:hypothetical protein
MGRFRDALAEPGLRAIAEVKRRSPSAGDLRPDADAPSLARSFAESGAAAVSILVDERFGGSFADLEAARAATDIPLLAKGFFDDQGDLLPAPTRPCSCSVTWTTSRRGSCSRAAARSVSTSSSRRTTRSSSSAPSRSART